MSPPERAHTSAAPARQKLCRGRCSVLGRSMSAQKGRGRKTTQAILKEGVSPQHLQVRRAPLHPSPGSHRSDPI